MFALVLSLLAAFDNVVTILTTHALATLVVDVTTVAVDVTTAAVDVTLAATHVVAAVVT